MKLTFLSEKVFIDFCLNSNESDYDSSVGGLSSGEEDMTDQELLNNYFKNNTR